MLSVAGGREMGVVDRAIAETPIAILDLETTGISPGSDRVLEVSVMRREPDGTTRLILDTLVNPCRPVAATEIHGITDNDVVDAPIFAEIADDLVDALADCVVAAYNVYFDMGFLDFELSQAGYFDSPPHFCLMYLRPMLALGKRCSLGDACKEYGISQNDAHTAFSDTQAAAQLLELYLDEARAKGVVTFGDLARLRSYKFTQSFEFDPFRTVAGEPREARRTAFISRTASSSRRIDYAPVREFPKTSPANVHTLRDYWEALKAALGDLEISDDEFHCLAQKRRSLRIPQEQVRVLHARLFASVLNRFAEDKWLDEHECETLARLYRCLSKLGWAPGESTRQVPRTPLDDKVGRIGDTPPSPRGTKSKQICLTGLFVSTRKELSDEAQRHGLRVVNSVTKKLHYLCVGRNAGPSKLRQAREQGVVVVTEKQLKEMFASGSVPDGHRDS
jgi:DNA polymerase III subunit epsilon